jgi:hypothetical protein
MDKKIEKYTRQSVFVELKEFCHLSREGSFIEMTEWTNGIGVDVVIASFQDRIISLSFGELEAIKELTIKLLEE